MSLPKSRWIVNDPIPIKEWRYGDDVPNGPPSQANGVTSQTYSEDLEYSQGNQYKLLGFGNQRIGGDFRCTRRYYSDWSSLGNTVITVDHPQGKQFGRMTMPQYAVVHSFNNTHFPICIPSSADTLYQLGREAIAETVPTKAKFNGSQFAGELREGLPHVVPFTESMRAKTLIAREAGGEYLNAQFGWKPLISDYHKFRNAVKNQEAILDAYERGSGKLIHKQKSWTMETKRERYVRTGYPSPYSTNGNFYYGGGYVGTLTQTVTSTTKRWVKAVYTYWCPPRGSASRRASDLNKVYGTNITPETLWELAPWSWAADWVADIGTTQRNLTAFQTDSLVMPWAYVMEHKTVTSEYRLDGMVYSSHPNHIAQFRQTFTTECKSRVTASPYGFGLLHEDLTPRQVAILAALGIARSG